MKKKNPSLNRTNVIEFIKSNIAGNSMFVTTYITYFICDAFFGLSVELSLLCATIAGNTLGILLNFLFQKFWVFKPSKRAPVTMQVGRYIVFIIMNAAINFAIIYALEIYLNVTPYIGQFIAGWFFAVWNYFWYKLWVFKKASVNGITKTNKKAA